MDWMDGVSFSVPFAGTDIFVRMGYQDFANRHRWAVGRHCNANYEFHLSLSGSFSIELDQEEIPFHAGDGVLVAPGCFHCPHDLPSDFERFTLCFTPDAVSPVARQLGRVQSYHIVHLADEQMRLCRSILEEIVSPSVYHTDRLRALTILLLAYLLQDLLGPREPVPPDAPLPGSRLSIIDKFFSPWPEPFGTEGELAELLHLSRRQLNRILMQNYGMGFRQKMLLSRMEYAGWLLRTTDKKVGEIGILVGYTAESSFYRAFSAFYNVTPHDYRSTHTSENKTTNL